MFSTSSLEDLSSSAFFEKLVWTVSDVAQALNCSERHVRKLVSKDKIPFSKVGKSVRFLRNEILEWLHKGGTR